MADPIPGSPALARIDGSWLAGAAAVLAAVGFCLKLIPATIREFRANGGPPNSAEAKEAGRWEGATTAILQRLAECMENLTEGQRLTNTILTRIEASLAMNEASDVRRAKRTVAEVKRSHR